MIDIVWIFIVSYNLAEIYVILRIYATFSDITCLVYKEHLEIGWNVSELVSVLAYQIKRERD